MGYQPKGGTPVGQGFKANSPNDSYWMFLMSEAFDGLKTVNTKEEMYAIPLPRMREKTSLCFVAADLAFYQLIKMPTSGLTAADHWKKLPLGEGGSPLTPLGAITPDQVLGLLSDTGKVGDFYLVEQAGVDGTVVDNQEVFGQIITVFDGDWILKGTVGWRHLKMSSSVPLHTHNLSEVQVKKDNGTIISAEDYLKTLFVAVGAVLEPTTELDAAGKGSSIPTAQHVLSYVQETMSAAGSGGTAFYAVASVDAMKANAASEEVVPTIGDHYFIEPTAGVIEDMFIYKGGDISLDSSYVSILQAKAEDIAYTPSAPSWWGLATGVTKTTLKAGLDYIQANFVQKMKDAFVAGFTTAEFYINSTWVGTTINDGGEFNQLNASTGNSVEKFTSIDVNGVWKGSYGFAYYDGDTSPNFSVDVRPVDGSSNGILFQLSIIDGVTLWDYRTVKTSISLKGYGELADGTGGDYSTLKDNSLVPAKWVIDNDIKYIQEVNTLVERDAIPSNLRRTGMMVRVVGEANNANNGLYNLASDLTTWNSGYVLGNGSAGGIKAVSTGNGTASGDWSLATGTGTTASGYAAQAHGSGSVASGGRSFASGLNAKATGTASAAIGNDLEASNSYSMAVGSLVLASGYASFAGGVGNPFAGKLISSGRTAFNYSERTKSNIAGAAADNSAILGGIDNQLQSTAERSVILGGQDINATEPDTVYAPKMHIIEDPTTDNHAVNRKALKSYVAAPDVKTRTQAVDDSDANHDTEQAASVALDVEEVVLNINTYASLTLSGGSDNVAYRVKLVQGTTAYNVEFANLLNTNNVFSITPNSTSILIVKKIGTQYFLTDYFENV